MRRCPKCDEQYESAVSFCPRDGEVLQESSDELVGRVLDGKYEVESFIARGGMGAVYLARHILLGDRVVIKTLRSEMRSNSEWLRRFQREGRAARSFRHPNAVTVYDLSAADDGLVYLVMEYVEGHTLDRELKGRGRLAPAEALELLRPVADVLDAAHARGVVHRDLKPENIILGRTESGGRLVKVLDLGIAKLKGMPDGQTLDAGPLTVAGQVLGTPHYMSPEQWGETPRDGNPEVDGRADVYSLGMICFELVAGRKPLGGRTLSELRHEHVSKPLPLLHEVAPGVPEEFGRAVARAMSKDRADRYATAGEFVAQLRGALATSAGANDEGTLYRDGRVSGDEGARGRVADTSAPPSSYVTVIDESLARPAAEGDTAMLPAQRKTDAHAAARTAVGLTPAITSEQPPRASETESATALAVPAPQQTPPSQGARVAESTRSRGPVIAAAALGLVILACVGGWLAWNRMRADVQPEERVASRAVEPVAEAPRVEALSYWLEAFGRLGEQPPRRVAETAVELSSSEQFKFHFVARERGYLYIVGPARDGNAHMIFLGAQGAGKLKTNLLAAGADFAFPFGELASLQLDSNPGAEDYTIIFSPTPLLAPAALTQKATHTLTLAELKELEDFRAQHRDDALKLNVKGEPGSDGGRAVAVTVPEKRDASRPLIFDVRIEHK